MENPIYKWMMEKGYPHDFGSLQIKPMDFQGKIRELHVRTTTTPCGGSSVQNHCLAFKHWLANGISLIAIPKRIEK